MTTISSSTTALSSLLSLSAKTNDASGTGSSALDTSQQSSILKMIEGGDSSANAGLAALLGTGSDAGTATGTDLSAILDAIQAQTDSPATATDGTGATGSTTGSTATTEQQKAATLMQSVYQSQQSNLFTLLG